MLTFLTGSSIGSRKIAIEIIQWLFFLLFVYSAADKLMDFGKFKLELGKSPILTHYSIYIAYAIPPMELIIAILVILPRTTLFGLYASFLLMTSFTAYIFFLVNYGEYIPCSCNGILRGASWNEHLIFNIIFVLLGAIGILLKSNHNSYKNV